MDEKEISVTFFISKDIMDEFEKAKEKKAKTVGISLTKKQALQLAIKEAIENW
jgi:rRNA-processing protein FCF1